MSNETIKSIVRRLTPVETSRLMGFPDGYLFIDGQDTPDSPMYKACGNSWGVNSAEVVNIRTEIVLRELGIVPDGSPVRYATTCSGVEAHSLSVDGRNWQAHFYSEIEPFPCKVLAARYPTVPNLGDMTKVDGTKYKLDVFSGGTPCFTAGNMVLTETGYRPIETIRIGDKVITHNGRLRAVTDIGKKMASNIVSVKCKSAPWIRCTDDHKFWTATNPHRDYSRTSDTYLRTVFDGMEFKPIKDIGVGGFASRIAEYEHVDLPECPTLQGADKLDIMEIAGWYVGDGHCAGITSANKTKYVVLSVNADKFAKFAKRFGERIRFSSYTHDKNGVIRIEIHSASLCDWLVEHFGHKSLNKRIPAWLICADNDVKQAFLEGYNSTDGFTTEDFVFACSTVSLALALGISDLVGKCSMYESNVPPQKTMYDGRVVNQHNFWNVRRFETPKCFHKYQRWDLVRVVKIVEQPPEVVYNITVDEDHSYVVNGICVRNCQSFSVAGKRHGLGGSTSWDDTTTRSSLAFHWVRIGLEAESPILLWENVPGVYSSSEGKDFPWLVHFLNDHGFVVAWRTFDVQWQMTRRFPRAIPQRRRRCWLVAYKGEDWRIPARILFERTSKLGSFAPDRVVNGVKIERKDSCDQVVDLFGPTGPSFNKDSRADMIPFSEMPDKFVPAKVLQFMRKCGTVGFCGNIFKGDADPDNIDKNLRDNIGNAGIAKGDFIITMKTPEWNAGIQLSEGEECPSEYDGTVCGLSDILEPMREGMSKYFLSSRACEGILHRADKRGKDLPDKLEKALHAQIENWSSGAFGDVAEPTTQEDGEDEDSGCEDGEE